MKQFSILMLILNESIRAMNGSADVGKNKFVSRRIMENMLSYYRVKYLIHGKWKELRLGN